MVAICSLSTISRKKSAVTEMKLNREKGEVIVGSRDVLVGGMMKAAASIDEIICILKLNEH